MSYGIEHTLSLWSMRVTPVGFCLRVIVNEKPINLEKATSSVLSVIVNKSMTGTIQAEVTN